MFFSFGTCEKMKTNAYGTGNEDDFSHYLKRVENLATSGHIFTGEKIRSFPSHKVNETGVVSYSYC